MTEQITVDTAAMINTHSHGEKIDYAKLAHSLINPLRRDRNLDSSFRRYLSRCINIKCFPNRKRVTIRYTPWSETPRLIRIDSHAKNCDVCGNKAYYIVNEITNIYAWRRCWRHISNADRESLIEYYTTNNSELSEIE